MENESLSKSSSPIAKDNRPEWFRSKLSEIGQRVIVAPHPQSVYHQELSSRNSGPNLATLAYNDHKGIPGAAHGGKIRKFGLIAQNSMRGIRR